MTFEIAADVRTVQLWSERRLPFEPKGELQEMRLALRLALGSLRGESLNARFSGPDGGGFDLENVLFYNVGCSAFRSLATRSIAFDRCFEAPPAPSGSRYPWHHFYGIEPLPALWRASPDGVRFGVEGSGSVPSSAAAWWAATHAARPQGDTLDPGSPLSLTLHLASPRPLNLTDAVKKMTDGLLCAFHSQPGDASSELVARVARATGLPMEQIPSMLARTGALGPSKFVWPFGQNLQWSPADDRLVSVDMTWSPGSPGSWSLAVQLSPALPVGATT